MQGHTGRVRLKKGMAIVIVGGLLIAASATARSSTVNYATITSGESSARAQLFAVFYRPGPNWKVGLPMNRQALSDHVRYYLKGVADGRVFAGGGLVAVSGGVAILTLPSLREAEAFLAADPAVRDGVFVGEVQVWTPAVLSDRPLKRPDPRRGRAW